MVLNQLGHQQLAAQHFEAYQRYRPDDNARDRAVALARSRDAAANHAAEAIVIYDLQRQDAHDSKGDLVDRGEAAGR